MRRDGVAKRAWLEDEFLRNGFSRIAGVDEAGRGPLAGPVVAAAVLLPAGFDDRGLDDSKKLSAKQREKLYARIVSAASAVGVGLVEAKQIDATDIRRASLEAMRLAYAELLQKGPSADLILVDGRDLFPLPEGAAPVEQRAIVGGDGKCRTVAAASIVAKVHRDRLMLNFHARWPEYGFDRHKGYPTRAHLEALRRWGPCPIHRRTFRGVKQ